MWEEHPDEMEQALARHDELMRAAIAAHDGYVFSTAGDAFAAAFTRADDAVRASIEAQEALVGTSWPGAIEIRVRMGVHTGEGQERGGDYFGPALNQAARVMSAANGDQILLSAVTEELVGGRLPSAYRVSDRGEHRLKDLSRTQRLFELTGGQLRTVRTPLRTIDSTPGNLPRLLPPFVGREDDLAALQAALESNRLVTVTGPPGSGKTRLAIQAAAELAGTVPGGAWMVDLTAETTAEGVAEAVARALAFAPEAGLPPDEAVVDALRFRPVLLLLDNCEGALRPTAALAGRLLESCDELVILATSREQLRTPAEQVLPLGPMATVAAGEADPDAVAFFVERARAHGAGADRLSARRSAVVELCERLDGLPLAIELAAARAQSIDPEQLLANLSERFRMLTAGRRTTEGRHQTLRAAIDWSFGLLEARDRELFRRIAVFAGPFEASDATAVAGGAAELFDVLDGLSALVDQSMIVADATGIPGYRLLETLRAYGADELDSSGEADEVRRRHAEHFATKARATRRALVGPEHVPAVDLLVSQVAEYRSATSWALSAGEEGLAIQLTAGFCGASYYRIGYDALGWLGADAAELASPDRPLSVELLGLLARNARFGGRSERSVELAERAVAMDPGPESAQARSQLSIDAMGRGDAEAMVEWSRSTVEVSEAGGDDLGILLGLLLLGPQLVAMQQTDEAEAVGERLLALGAERDSEHARGWGHHVLARTLAMVDQEAAREHLAQAVAIGRSEKNRYLESNARLALFELSLAVDEPKAAARSALETLDELREAADNGYFMRLLLGELTTFLARLGRPEALTIDSFLERFSYSSPEAQTQRRRRVLDELAAELGGGVSRRYQATGAHIGAEEMLAQVAAALDELRASD